MVDDKVIQFGSVTADNFQGLQNIAAIVQHSIGVSYTDYSSYSTTQYWVSYTEYSSYSTT